MENEMLRKPGVPAPSNVSMHSPHARHVREAVNFAVCPSPAPSQASRHRVEHRRTSLSIPYMEPGPDASAKWMSLFEAIFHSGVVCDAARDKGYISSPLWESQNLDGLSELFQIGPGS